MYPASGFEDDAPLVFEDEPLVLEEELPFEVFPLEDMLLRFDLLSCVFIDDNQVIRCVKFESGLCMYKKSIGTGGTEVLYINGAVN
jgi:hypothetical protein